MLSVVLAIADWVGVVLVGIAIVGGIGLFWLDWKVIKLVVGAYDFLLDRRSKRGRT
jgi:hypothetical protein